MAYDAEQIHVWMEKSLPAGVWDRCRGHEIADKLVVYLRLLQRWNSVVNLTSVREPEAIVRRHFAESVLAGEHLLDCGNLLDLGSGAGFPGVPIQLMRPDLQVTLLESQGRKAAFLREVVRELGLKSRVVSARAETLPAAEYECVCLRAVDPMRVALREAGRLARCRVVVVGSAELEQVYQDSLAGWNLVQEEGSASGGSAVVVFTR